MKMDGQKVEEQRDVKKALVLLEKQIGNGDDEIGRRVTSKTNISFGFNSIMQRKRRKLGESRISQWKRSRVKPNAGSFRVPTGGRQKAYSEAAAAGGQSQDDSRAKLV